MRTKKYTIIFMLIFLLSIYFSLNVLAASATNEPSSNAELLDLKLSVGEFSPAFSPKSYTYLANFEEGISELNISAVPSQNKSTVNINWNKKLINDENIISIVVTAEDGLTKKEYMIASTEKGKEMIDSIASLSSGSANEDGIKSINSLAGENVKLRREVYSTKEMFIISVLFMSAIIFVLVLKMALDNISKRREKALEAYWE